MWTEAEDRLLTDRREDDWWYAQKVAGGELGYLPASFLAPDGSLDAEEYAPHLCTSTTRALAISRLATSQFSSFPTLSRPAPSPRHARSPRSVCF